MPEKRCRRNCSAGGAAARARRGDLTPVPFPTREGGHRRRVSAKDGVCLAVRWLCCVTFSAGSTVAQKRMVGAERDSSRHRWGLGRGDGQRGGMRSAAVEADRLAVEHRVLDDVPTSDAYSSGWPRRLRMRHLAGERLAAASAAAGRASAYRRPRARSCMTRISVLAPGRARSAASCRRCRPSRRRRPPVRSGRRRRRRRRC